MFAVIKTGGKQYKVSPGDKIRIETITAKEGEKVNFAEILLTSDGDKINLGEPVVSAAKVEGKVIANGRGKKVRILKFKAKKRYKRVSGHRQNFTEVEILSVKP